MTTQMKDSFYYEGEHWNLFDVSDEKLLSCKECAGEASGTYCTALYRDTLAAYEVEDGILVLRENSAYTFDFFKEILTRDFYLRRKPPRCEPGTVIPLTGHLIIFRGGHAWDWFHCIFDVGEALELEFDEGLFIGALDLAKFIEAGRAYVESMTKGTDGLRDDYGFLHDIECMMEVMKGISPVVPQGNYSSSIYTWRPRPSECVLCKSLETE